MWPHGLPAYPKVGAWRQIEEEFWSSSGETRSEGNTRWDEMGQEEGRQVGEKKDWTEEGQEGLEPGATWALSLGWETALSNT